MDTTTIVDPEPFQNDFELSVGTKMGVNSRICPVCKKKQKVERLGEHVHKHHPEFWAALFPIESLQKALDDKALVACTIAEADHDQKFLVCLACDSVRTTDRNHFQKNGEVHLNSHLEMATRMIATRRGVKYVPKAETDMQKLLTQLDKYKRIAKMCEHDHSDVGAAIADKEEAEREPAELRQTVEHLKKGSLNLQKIINAKNEMMANINMAIKMAAGAQMLDKPLKERDLLAFGKIMTEVSRTIQIER
jgi:hypothetical protein